MDGLFQYPDRGFTLVELAVVLVIVGMLITIGAGLIGPLVKSAKYNETKETLTGALDSVTGFGTVNNRVPTTAEFPSAVRVPKDAWGAMLIYIPEANLVDTTAGGICGRKTTSITVLLCPDAACASPTATITDVAFVVLSGGENKNIQTASAAGTVKVYDPDIPGVDDYTADMNRAEAYDDIVKWLTLNELRIKAGCVGTQLKVLNNEMPSGTVGTAYSAEAYSDGGVPYASGGKYGWCVQGSLPSGISIKPNTTSADCAALAEGSWGRRDSLAFSGKPKASGSFNITIFSRDNNDSSSSNDNVAQKSLVLTINPAAGKGGKGKP
ncbi:MAG: type II secretion system protein [Thermodesulfobacteriota bacterium]